MGGVVGDFAEAEKLAQQFASLKTAKWKKAFVANLAEEYRDFMTERFRAGESPYGDKWVPLKFRSSANGKGQKPLADTGVMRGAITPINVTSSGFKVSVGVKYATTHQFGAVIVPKKAKALKFRGVSYKQVGKGTRRQHGKRRYSGWIFVRKVTIPARPFAPLQGIPAALAADVQDASDDFMEAHFGQ